MHYFYFHRQYMSVPFMVSVFIAALILLPIANLTLSSFTTTRLGFRTGFTLSNYLAAYTDSRFAPTLANSLIYAGGSTFLGLMIAIAFSWMVTRTNTPLKKFFGVLPLFPLLLPPMMDNIAWIYLLAPRSGVLNRFLIENFGIGSVFNVFSLPAMIWVFGLSLVPLMYLMILPAFLMEDSSLEEAAYLSGAGILKTLRVVTLPLLMPTIVSATLIGLLHGLRSFETPALQGIPGNVPVFISLIYESAELDFNYGLAVAYATTLLIITLFLVWAYLRVTRVVGKFSAVTGRGIRPKVADIGRWRYVGFSLLLSYCFIAIVLPLITIIIGSITPFFSYEVFTRFYQYFTLSNYGKVINHPTFVKGILNGLYIGLGVSFTTVFIGAIMAYFVQRSKILGRKIFESLATASLGFPGLVLALGLLSVYIGTPLYGNLLGIFIALIIVYLPYSFRISSGSLIRIHPEIDEAAYVHGASLGQTFRMITMRLLRPALASGLFYIFISAYREVGAIVLLTGPGASYGAVTLFEYYRLGQWAETAAGSVIYVILLFSFLLLAKYALKIRFSL